jgi:hypothetical protein
MRHVAAVSRPLSVLRRLPGRGAPAVWPPSLSSPAVRASPSSSLSSLHGPGCQLLSPTRRATTVLAQLLADVCHPGDVVCLHGGVGTGKSFFWCAQEQLARRDWPMSRVRLRVSHSNSVF